MYGPHFAYRLTKIPSAQVDRLIGRVGPTWTHSSTSESPQRERKMDGWRGWEFTPEQQQSLHVDADGVKLVGKTIC